ncbi:hypothetical protein C0989_001041 [Termitomyces sp. Mn162]|nr:hypothetical protein C0989_001041 [Termitomyces sp. Mn162]
MSPIAESLETPIPLTATKIAEMRLVDNSSNPIITSVGKITSAWPGHILDKDNGNYIDWAYAMRLELPMVQLWDYIFDLPPAPHTIYEPCIHCAWTSNKCLACSFIKHAILPSEQKLCMDEEDPVVLWKYLEEHHGGAILFLEGEQTLLDADKSMPAAMDERPTAFVAKPFRESNLTCMTCKAHKQPVQIYTGHTAPWCILKGGAMEGKTIEESKRKHLAYYENLKKEKGRKKTSKVTFTLSGGNAFTIEEDPDTIMAYLAAQAAK